MSLVDWFHRWMVRDEGWHAELLNQYRSSEDFGRRYPRTVCVELIADAALRVKYEKHQADEERHEGLYAERIGELQGTVGGVGESRDYMLNMWREASAAGVGIPYARFAEERPLGREELARMWALQTVVEERGLVEMDLHRRACVSAGDARTAEVLDAILPDERHHAAYSRRALEESGPGWEAVLARMVEVEARVQRRVSGAFLAALARMKLGLQKGDPRPVVSCPADSSAW